MARGLRTVAKVIKSRKQKLSVALPAVVAAALALAPAATASGFAYLTDYFGGSVSVIDTATNDTVAGPIPTDQNPQEVAITPDATEAYVANGGGTVNVIDTATMATSGDPIRVDPDPRALAISPDGSRAYVANVDGTVTVIDTATRAIVGPVIDTGGELGGGIAIAPDGARAYVTEYRSGTMSVIDTATGSLVGPPVRIGASAYRIAITPDGRRAYVTDLREDEVSVIDLATNAKAAPDIPVGDAPGAIAITPDGSRAYVANSVPDASPGSVTVIDTATNTRLGDIPVSQSPQRIAITPDGAHAYVVGAFFEITVIDTRTNTPLPDPFPASLGAIAITPAQPPHASLAVSGTRATPGEQVIFDGGGSTNPDPGGTHYNWNLGDGTVLTDGDVIVGHTYAQAGAYDATLRVADDQGCSADLVFTGATAYCNGSGVAAATRTILVGPRPRIRQLKVVPRTFGANPSGTPLSRRKPRRGTEIAFQLSVDARVRFRVRRDPAVKRGAPPPAHPHVFKRKLRAGAHLVPFTGTLGGRTFRPGRYQVIARARAELGPPSERARTRFTVRP
jgi:YVTN family beta-propeller protein